MGAAPSNPRQGGKTRNGSGAQTHFRGWGPSLTLLAMVHGTKLSPDGEVDCYPLSPMQQGMLYHRVSGGARGVDVEQVIGELHEVIDAAKFEDAWREVVARHAPLRTGFQWEGDEPRQCVLPPSRVRLALHHQDFGSAAEARRGLQEYLIADRREGFRSLNAPLLRVALLRGGPAHFWFVTTYHHLLLDARSMTIVFREVMELHDALVQGRTLDLPKPRPYRSYIDWLQSHDHRRAEKFWREQLRGFAAPTRLPIARALEPVPSSSEAGELAFRLPAAATSALRSVAQKHEVTLNTIVQAAWSAVLSRFTGEEDIVFGAVRAGRKIPVEGADAMVGLFINTVPVRVQLTPSAPIGTWLRQIRAQWLALRDFEHTPLFKIQQWSDVAPGQPLFESIISYQEPAWDAALNALGGAWANRSFDIRAQPNFPLALEVLAGATLTVKLIHEPARFASHAIARLLAHLRNVLQAFATEAADTVAALPLLTREEIELLTKWNETSAEFPREGCVHTLVETRARTAPASVAIADPARTLTYAELNSRANQLAHCLRKLGVTRGALVSVCMERSAEMIVAWLAIVKAGGAFVPLDPAYPPERLAFQIVDSGTEVVLVQQKAHAILPVLSSRMTVLEIPPGGVGFEEESTLNPDCDVGPSDVAYVIYTSGSTGRPKGVEVEHRALMNLVTWHQRTYAVTTEDRATHLASPAFDASVWEIWPYLASGASVHMPDDETRLSPALLWRWMAQHRISIAFMPTPLAEAAMGEALPDGLALRALLTGGDTLKRRPPREFPCPLINHYGPTESAVVATCTVIRPDAPAGATLPIGKPIANTQVYVLDRHLRHVPVGVPGELFIGGESLARGYLRRPELTAEKFLPHPFRSGGARVYRTGDRVRWTENGELEFLGRIDGQVKIRGCRIELGEIEAALHLHPAARECLVQTRTDERGELKLVAYVVGASDARRVNATKLTDFLREKLPAYMVPPAIILLDAWPLTPNGKIDRAALPDAPGAIEAVRASAAPRNAIEETICRVWADVLARPRVGRDDNFFDLGGHSLLAAQIVTRLNATFPGAVTVRALFDQPTLAGFAREVEQRLGNASASRAPVQRPKRRLPRPDLELVQPT